METPPENEWELTPIEFENENGEAVYMEMTPESIAEQYEAAASMEDTREMEKYRALHELLTLKDDLELTDGDSEVPQLGGLHKSVRSQLSGFESHHIPAQSVQAEKADELPSIAITAEDHHLTDSYRGKSHRKYSSFLPDDNNDTPSYKQEAQSMIENGDYMDLVRDELYNIREHFGHKYDGAIKQYLNAMAKMIAEKGVPDTKK